MSMDILRATKLKYGPIHSPGPKPICTQTDTMYKEKIITPRFYHSTFLATVSCQPMIVFCLLNVAKKIHSIIPYVEIQPSI